MVTPPPPPLLQVGFFYLSGHGVDLNLMDTVLEEAESFFASDQEEKDRIWIGNSRYTCTHTHTHTHTHTSLGPFPG